MSLSSETGCWGFSQLLPLEEGKSLVLAALEDPG